MTNERAIELLNRISDSQFDGIHGDERREALEMAVKALEQLPSAQLEKRTEERTETHACDCISRQAAIDRINKQREHLHPDIYPQDKIGDAAYRICAEFIERLPSAQQRWIPAVSGCQNSQILIQN